MVCFHWVCVCVCVRARMHVEHSDRLSHCVLLSCPWMAPTQIPHNFVHGANPPPSIIHCSVFMFDWSLTAASLPSQAPKSHTGNRQYKHRVREILSCLASELQNLCKHTQTLATHFEKVCKTMSHHSSGIRPISCGNNRFGNISGAALSSCTAY